MHTSCFVAPSVPTVRNRFVPGISHAWALCPDTVPAGHLERRRVPWGSTPHWLPGDGKQLSPCTPPHNPAHRAQLHWTQHPLPYPRGHTKESTAPLSCAEAAHPRQDGNTSTPQQATQATAHADSRTDEAGTSLDLQSRQVWGHKRGFGAMTQTEPTAIFLLCPLATFSQECSL